MSKALVRAAEVGKARTGELTSEQCSWELCSSRCLLVWLWLGSTCLLTASVSDLTRTLQNTSSSGPQYRATVANHSKGAWYSQSSKCLCSLTAGIKGMHHHAQLKYNSIISIFQITNTYLTSSLLLSMYGLRIELIALIHKKQCLMN